MESVNETTPVPDNPTAPDKQGIPEQSDEQGSTTEKRVDDTLKAAQEKFHNVSLMEKDLKLKAQELDQMLAKAKQGLVPHEEPPQPFKVEFDDGFKDSLIDDPEKAQRSLEAQFSRQSEYYEGQIANLYGQLNEMNAKSTIEDEAVREAMKKVDADPAFSKMPTDERIRVAQMLVEAGPKNEEQAPPGGLGSSHRPVREAKPEKPTVPEAYYQASGAAETKKDRQKVWL